MNPIANTPVFLGHTGMSVTTRLIGLIPAVIGKQMIIAGITRDRARGLIVFEPSWTNGIQRIVPFCAQSMTCLALSMHFLSCVSQAPAAKRLRHASSQQ